MNDLVKFGGGGLPTNQEDLLNGLQHVSAGLSGRSGGTPILRLLKSGVYAYGQEDIEPQEGSRWAINPHSFSHGFVCWGDGELLGETMVPLNQPPPNVNELQDYGEPWDQQISFNLQCLNGEDTGVTVIYKSGSVGFLNMAKQLIDQVVLQLQHDPVNYVPVVELEMGNYHHKQWGKTYFPVLDVLKWLSIDGAETAKPSEEMTTAEGAEEAAKNEPEKPVKEAKAEPEKPARRGRKKRPAAEPITAEVPADAPAEEQPHAADEDATAAVVAEMEGKGEATTQSEKPKGRRRRRAV